MSDTTIDDIERILYELAGPERTFRVPEAKSALYELMLSVIGEDEKLKPDENGKYNLMRLTENQLKAEQRNKLKELMK